MKQPQPNRSAKGAAAIVALLFLAMFTAMSVAFFTSSSMNLAQASNLSAVTDSRLAAESGVAFLTHRMVNCGVSGSLRGQRLLDSLAAKLQADLNGTATLGGASITYDSHSINVPAVSLGAGTSFSGRITLQSADTLRLTITGQHNVAAGAASRTVRRQVSLDFHPTWDQALGYGLCSKGPVEMGLNTDLSGVSEASDGSIYSAASGTAVSIITGHVSGDISVSASGAVISAARVVVDGEVSYDAPPVTMPVIDRSPYKALATNIVDSHTDVSSGTFKNILVKANTNPIFGSVTIQGVMYIESPNVVQFTNNVNFTGVMAADDPAPGSSDATNYVSFKNCMVLNGPEQLPDTSEFHEVRKLQGSSVLCPGLTMEFKNNMTSIGGIMALKSLIAKNNLYSTILGTVLIYGNDGLDFKNNTDLDIRLSGSSPPSGFAGHGMAPLLPDPQTYTEY